MLEAPSRLSEFSSERHRAEYEERKNASMGGERKRQQDLVALND